MLSENIRNIRKAKGLSQEELAVKLNVVRQTVSKWEQGLSVPDADLLISLSEALETPVSTLLGETVREEEADELTAISQKLEVINLQLAKEKERKRRNRHRFFLGMTSVTVLLALLLFFLGSPYLEWDLGDPETAVLATLFHSFEWAFVRLLPFLLIGSVTGIVLTGERKE